MAQKPSLLQAARDRAPGFTKPDIQAFIPPDQQDAVARVVAAGQKLMYSPDMRDELMAEVEREGPPAQKMAEAVTGLLLTLDGQAQGGIPLPAMFPAAMELLGEAAEVLNAAGQAVTQNDYNEAAQTMFVLIARKLGADDEQIMQGAQQAMAGGEAVAMEAEPGAEQQAAAPADEEEAAMAAGMAA